MSDKRYNPQESRRKERGSGRSSGGRARTRFDVTATERSALPRALPRVPRLLALGVPLAIALAAGAVWYGGPAWRVNEIDVIKNDAVPREQIIGASGLQNEHFHFVDLAAAAKRIDDLPGVEAAQVTCEWHGSAQCVIAIQPAKPLAIWLAAAGNVWTDYEGKVQRAPGQMAAKYTIRVEDGEVPPIGVPLDPRLLRALIDLESLPVEMRGTAGRLAFSQEFGLMFDNAQGARVRLGLADRDGAMLEKARLAQVLAEQLSAKGITPRIIDVRFARAPYYIK